MRRAVAFAAALWLVACGDGSQTTETDMGASALEQAAAAEDLPAALEAGQRLVDDLLAQLGVEPRERSDVRPYRVSLCDVAADPAPSLVSVARGIAFPAERTAEVVAEVRERFEAIGLDGVRVVGDDTDAPLVTGVFADQSWQVAATLNAVDGIGEVRVNSRCLPGEVPEPPAAG